MKTPFVIAVDGPAASGKGTIAAKVASDALTPERRKLCSPKRLPPTSKHKPMMPLRMIITEAKTVSRARALASGPPASIRVTIKATSMTVMAPARTRVP